jgi:putative DNA primase/helicase
MPGYIAAGRLEGVQSPLVFRDSLIVANPDATLPTRFLKVEFRNSMLGKEDHFLEDKLRKELSGIAARCARAYRRLCERGRFVQPRSGADLEAEVLEMSNPFVEMTNELFVPDPDGFVIQTVARMKFEMWCRERGWHELIRGAARHSLEERLPAVPGFESIRDERPRINGRPTRVFAGMKARPREK